MNIKIKIVGPPYLTESLGKENILECRKGTIKELIDKIIERFSFEREMSQDRNESHFFKNIQVIINDYNHVEQQDFEKVILKHGDTVTFIGLIAGG